MYVRLITRISRARAWSGPKVLLGRLSPQCYRKLRLQDHPARSGALGQAVATNFGERTTMTTMAVSQAAGGVMRKDERLFFLASSLGPFLEGYVFYLYGSLASIIGAHFSSPSPPATRDIFALLAFAAGFLVRPFGAIVFGR